MRLGITILQRFHARLPPPRTASSQAVDPTEDICGGFCCARPLCYVWRVIEDDHPASLLEVRGLTKTFGAARALSGVDLDVKPGEVHCVLGQNGAGKSTLIKTLSGAHQPDEGEIRWFGEAIALPTPQAAMRHGIATIYQEL